MLNLLKRLFGRLSLDQDGEEEMADFECPQCREARDVADSIIRVQATRTITALAVELFGILKCTHHGYEWPIRLVNNVLHPEQPSLIRESKKLKTRVPKGLRQDIEEGERAHLLNLNKATVVMCRRALQLALENKLKGVTGFPTKPTLGSLLVLDKAQQKPKLSVRTNALAEGIKDYGDGGAHRREVIDAETARSVVFITVQALNDLYSRPASKSKTGSNEQ